LSDIMPSLKNKKSLRGGPSPTVTQGVNFKFSASGPTR
jgi:hypothetical protein